jgi:hypothetical protein
VTRVLKIVLNGVLLQKGYTPLISDFSLSKTVAFSAAFRIGRDAMHIQYDWEKKECPSVWRS